MEIACILVFARRCTKVSSLQQEMIWNAKLYFELNARSKFLSKISVPTRTNHPPPLMPFTDFSRLLKISWIVSILVTICRNYRAAILLKCHGLSLNYEVFII